MNRAVIIKLVKKVNNPVRILPSYRGSLIALTNDKKNQSDKHTFRKAIRQTYIQKGNQTNIHTERQSEKHTYRKAIRQINIQKGI